MKFKILIMFIEGYIFLLVLASLSVGLLIVVVVVKRYHCCSMLRNHCAVVKEDALTHSVLRLAAWCVCVLVTSLTHSVHV
jgi:hypothetical protein